MRAFEFGEEDDCVGTVLWGCATECVNGSDRLWHMVGA